jgi:hypothetical protein
MLDRCRLEFLFDDQIAPLETLRPGLHPQTLALVRRCLARDFRARFADTEELLSELRAVFTALKQPFPEGLQTPLPRTWPASFPPEAGFHERLAGPVDELLAWLRERCQLEFLPPAGPAARPPAAVAPAASGPARGAPGPETHTPQLDEIEQAEAERRELEASAHREVQTLHSQLAPILRAAKQSHEAAERRSQTTVTQRLRESMGGVLGYFRGLTEQPAAGAAAPASAALPAPAPETAVPATEPPADRAAAQKREREEGARRAREQHAREEAEWREAEQKARAELARREKEQAERTAREEQARLERERQAKEQQERQAREQQVRAKAERRAREEKELRQVEQKARAEQPRREAEDGGVRELQVRRTQAQRDKEVAERRERPPLPSICDPIWTTEKPGRPDMPER